jgi:hypothetical protein
MISLALFFGFVARYLEEIGMDGWMDRRKEGRVLEQILE